MSESTTVIPDTGTGGRRLRVILGVDHLMGSLGLFSLFPVLGLLLAARTPGSGAAVVGVGLFCYTASAGVSALLINRLLAKVRYVDGMACSLVLSGVGFGLLPYAASGPVLCGLLVLAGLGVSTHFILSRVLIAEVVPDNIGRNRIYSMLQIAVNASAAAGPFIASFLYIVDARLLLAVVSLCYLLAAASLYLGLPRNRRPPPTTGRWPISKAVLRDALRTPSMRRVVLVSTLGAFVYAQFYSAFALFVGHGIDSATLRAVLLAGPAVSIVLLQSAVSAVAARLMKTGTKPFTVLGYATLLFGIAMLLLGLGLPLVAGASLAVLVFSLAEMAFTPMVSTAFVALPIDSSLEAFNLRQVCWTTGEALGSFVGGSLFLALYLSGHPQVYWLSLAVLTLAGTAALMVPVRWFRPLWSRSR